MRKGSIFSRTLAASAFLASTVSIAFAQAGAVSEQLDAYKSVSQELLTLYERAKDNAAASSIAAEIDAAVKKRDAVEAALSEAMKKLDPKNEQDGKLLQSSFAEIQVLDKTVGDAQLRAVQSQAAAQADKNKPEVQKE